MWNRREMLVSSMGLAGWLAMPIPASAAATSHGELARQMRASLMGFDLGEAAKAILSELKFNKRWIKAVDQVLEGKDAGGGIASFVALSDDEETQTRLNKVGDKARKNLTFLLDALHALKRAPQTEEGRQAMLQWCYDTVGLDMATYRQAVSELPAGGVLFWGAVTDLGQLSGQIVREPFELYVSLVFGVRFESRFSDKYPDAFHDLVRVCVDRSVTHFAFAGHGTWSTMAMKGVYQHPDHTFADLCKRAKKKPRRFAVDIAKWSTRSVLGKKWSYDELGEVELSKVAVAFGPEPLKQRVARYSCGSQRYRGPNRLLWMLLPDDLRDEMHIRGADVGPALPDSDYEGALGDWLAEVAPEARIEERIPFGTCLVADPAHTIGYQGITWIHHFIDDPTPSAPPVAPFAKPWKEADLGRQEPLAGELFEP